MAEVLEPDFKEAKKLILTLRPQIASLESGQDVSVMLQGRVATNMTSLIKCCARLQENMKSLSSVKRETWSLKLEPVLLEQSELKKAMEQCFNQINKSVKEEEMRQKLLSNYHANLYQNDEKRLYEENKSINQSLRIADEVQRMADSVRSTLVDQNFTLKMAHRKVMDVINSFEMSRSVIRMIEKRQYTDKVIVYSGIFMICIIVGLIWWFK
eukprot:TRINITY_DN5999_c0_g1_i2.p1 TRINITY_DN5999_c0_g1~~TRINITY_DN5999_c0_g1_i2.p1  ORF type:complete len:212 (-),score=22.70 TRINITY_DN5999_c0_g1_i2:13-648(-)